ncbi:MAG: hypothetical protein ACTSYJ_00120 [Candidatus Thorarchaeota archaeon]
MPNYEVALPPGAYNIKIVSNSGQEIPVDWSFTRDGKDGAEVIVPLFGGDEFIGEVLEGNWQKGFSTNMTGPFTAKLNGSGFVELTGQSTADGTWGSGWISSQSKVPLLDDIVIDVHLKIDNITSTEGAQIEIYLSEDGTGSNPAGDNYIRIILRAITTGYRIYIDKMVNGSTAILLGWTDVTNNEGTVRIRIQENKSGHRHTHFYYHDGVGDVDESTDEVSGSPFQLDLPIDSGYVGLKLATSTAESHTVSSDFIRVTYPDFKVVYDLDDVDVNKGDVKVWDTMGSSDEFDWQRVFDVNHQFVGDCVVENGLIRLRIKHGQIYGLELYYWNGSAWDFVGHVKSRVGDWLYYVYFKQLTSISTESVSFKVRLSEATENTNYFEDLNVTVRRGSYLVQAEIDDFAGNVVGRLHIYSFNESEKPGFSYVGGQLVWHRGITGDFGLPNSNDNYTLSFGALWGYILMIARTDNDNWWTFEGFPDASESVQGSRIFLGVLPYSGTSYLFKEAEDAAIGGGATIDTSLADDGGDSVLLNAQGEYVEYHLTGGSDLPTGRYLVFIRAKDTNQVTDDLKLWFKNTTDNRWVSQENAAVYKTLTTSFAYYGVIVDITSNDVGDSIILKVEKNTTAVNSIYVDYFLIIPLTNGESWPQDLAYNAMRSVSKQRKIDFR